MSIIQIAREQKRGLVTARGRKIRIYDENCNGVIHGTVIGTSGEHVLTRWDLEGENSMADYMNLQPYNLVNHFDWRILPGWANAWVFKQDDDWFCTSMKPTFRKAPISAPLGAWVPNNNANTYILPELVSKDILWDCTSEESLTCNPKYNEEEVS